MNINSEATNNSDYYKIMLDNIPTSLQICQLLYDDQGVPNDYVFLDVNSIFAEIMGLDKDEIIGKKNTDFYSDTESEYFIKYGEIVKNGKAEIFEMRSRPCSSWHSVLAVALGKQGKFAIIGSDITKRKKMEEAQKTAEEEKQTFLVELLQSEKKALALVSELKKADKNKDEFISVLSHELRNPLATITGGITLLKIRNENDKNKETIKILERQVEYLSKLVDGLLDITRISQNKIVLKKERVSLNTIVKESIEDMKVQFEEKNIELLEDLFTGPVLVNVDPLRITQCINNILKNSLKFTGENGRVSISLKIEEKNAVISIEDSGIGISHEALSSIFEPFKQDPNPLKGMYNNGLGLGLSIVKNYMEIHGGTISVSSPGIGKGSTFTMRLPIFEK